MLKNIFLGSEISSPDVADALFHIVPVELESSVSYGHGTAAGPRAIIEASNQLETYDQLYGEPCQFGIFTHPPLDCQGTVPEALARLRASVCAIAEKRKIPITLGGEHTLSYGSVMGVVDAYSDTSIGVVQFDAHADLREQYEGSIWSHACVMKRLVDEGLPLFQIGIRAISTEEQRVRMQFSKQIHYQDAKDICRYPIRHHLKLPDNFPQKIYITVDIDGLDSAAMPATGTPVPGGLSFWQLIDLLCAVSEGREVVGMDLVEFSPITGLHAYDYAAADIVYKMMGIVAHQHNHQ